MRTVAAALALVVALAGIAPAGSAFAHGYGHRYGYGYGPRVSLGFVFGGPAYWGYPYPYYYYPPAYYYPPVMAAPAEPTVYIERPRAQAEPQPAQDYWYYCPEAQAYYPYVKQCAKGWQKVSPQPPN